VGRVPILVDVLAARDQRRILGRSGLWRLPAVVVGQTGHHGIIERRGHAPHVAERVRIAPGLRLERLQLCDQVIRLLRGQYRKLGRVAVTVRAMTGGAGADGDTLRRSLGRRVDLEGLCNA
jgi:hypothetical protein